MRRSLRDLASELSRRGVIKAGIAYVIGAFVVLQVLDLLLRAFLVPDWVFALLFMLALLGLPVAVSLSWAFEWTPGHGFRTDPAPESGVLAGRPARFGLVALVLAVSGAVGVMGWEAGFAARMGPRPDDDRAGLDPGRVAILYLDDHSADGRLGHVAAGFTDALIHELAQVKGLEVLSRHAVQPFRGGVLSLDSIVAALRPGTVIHGSVEGSASEIRATVQLIDASSGANVLSRRLTGSGDDVLELRDQIVEEAAELLTRHLGQRIELARRRAGTENAEAWSLVRRAEETVATASGIGEIADTAAMRRGLEAADALLGEAHRLDQEWGEPIVLRAWNALRRAGVGMVDRERYDADVLRDGLAMAEQALTLNPDDPAALEIRGILRARLWRTWGPGTEDTLRAAAERDLLEAIRLDAGRPLALAEAAELARRTGRFEEAVRLAHLAHEADAFSLWAENVIGILCHVNVERRDFESAEPWCAEGARRFPRDARFPEVRLLLLASEGGPPPDVERAWELVADLNGLAPAEDRVSHAAIYLCYAAAVLARADLPDSARSVLARARAQAEDVQTPMLDYYEAHARLRLGETELALSRLRSFLEVVPAYRAYLPSDWWFEDLHADPRFIAIVEGQ